jgi:hypothetical protein
MDTGSSRGGVVENVEVPLSHNLALKAKGDQVSSGPGKNATANPLEEMDRKVGRRNSEPVPSPVDQLFGRGVQDCEFHYPFALATHQEGVEAERVDW